MKLNIMVLKGLILCMLFLSLSMKAYAFTETTSQHSSEVVLLQASLQDITSDMRDVTHMWVGGKSKDLTCDDYRLLSDRVVAQKIRLIELEGNVRRLRSVYKALAAEELLLVSEGDAEAPVVLHNEAQNTLKAINAWESQASSSIKLNGFVIGAWKRCQTRQILSEDKEAVK
jgi:hypothetical protein